jgi:hypothetical protein
MIGMLLRDVVRRPFDDMPEAVRRMHSVEITKEASGTRRVVGGTNPLRPLVRTLSASRPGVAGTHSYPVCQTGPLDCAAFRHHGRPLR